MGGGPRSFMGQRALGGGLRASNRPMFGHALAMSDLLPCSVSPHGRCPAHHHERQRVSCVAGGQSLVHRPARRPQRQSSLDIQDSCSFAAVVSHTISRTHTHTRTFHTLSHDLSHDSSHDSCGQPRLAAQAFTAHLSREHMLATRCCQVIHRADTLHRRATLQLFLPETPNPV